MKNLVFLLVISFFVTFCIGQSGSTYVNGYYKANGTYVEGYYRTTPNNSNWDTYSTQGNINPYNGASGTGLRDYSIGTYNTSQNQTIYIGPKGGQYYINSKGNKVYVPKR